MHSEVPIIPVAVPEDLVRVDHDLPTWNGRTLPHRQEGSRQTMTAVEDLQLEIEARAKGFPFGVGVFFSGDEFEEGAFRPFWNESSYFLAGVDPFRPIYPGCGPDLNLFSVHWPLRWVVLEHFGKKWNRHV